MRANKTDVPMLAVALLALMGGGCGQERAAQQAASEPAVREEAAGREAPQQTAGPAARQGKTGLATREQAAAKPQAETRAPLILPERTALQVRLVSTLSTENEKAGDSFEAVLVEPLVVGGRTVASKGAPVTGKVVGSDPGGRVKGVASIAVQLTGLRTDAGRELEISTGSVVRNASASKAKDAQKVGIGAGIGAAVGAIAGGGKGAAIGAAAGAGAGTGTVLATRGSPAVLPSETVLNFKLLYPVTVTD